MDSPEAARRGRAPRYPDEDVSPTGRKEILGWYAYAFAAEVFAVCGVGSFIPVTLEQLARERGVLLPERITPCVAPAVGQGAARSVLRSIGVRAEGNQCVVRLLGTEMNTASFPLYTSSIATLIQAITLVTFSSFADHGTYRKRLLLTFGFTGATASMLFIFVGPGIFLVASLLTIVGVVCLGSSFVILNSFLPVLVKNHPQAQVGPGRGADSPIPLGSVDGHGAIRLPDTPVSDTAPAGFAKQDSIELQLSTRISSNGVGIGYASAVFVQILCIVVLVILSKTSFPADFNLRVVISLVGVWWFVFTIPPYFWLKARPGPPFPAKFVGAGSRRGRVQVWIGRAGLAWGNLYRTLRVAMQLKQVLCFLAAWFLLSDGITTISSVAILFARTELAMSPTAIALLSITSTASGVAGATAWPAVTRRYGWRANGAIMACLGLMELIPLYGLLGYVPAIQRWGVGGMQQAWEMFPLAIVHGAVMGGLNAFCRSFYAQLIPPSHEAAFYALYAVTDKGSSSIGPALTAAIVDRYGSIRPAFIFIALLIALPLPLIYLVDADRGKADALRVADQLAHDEYIAEFGGEFGLGEEDEDEDEDEGEGEEDEEGYTDIHEHVHGRGFERDRLMRGHD